MPATAGRVRMPANNRVHSSAALQTHGIWQSAIGYDPYAPTNNNDKDSKPSADRGSSAGEDGGGGENAYASFQGLLALARITGTNADDTRGACKRCGRVGHLSFQCRNFLSLKAEDEKDDSAINKATALFREMKKAAGRKEEESEEEDEEEEEDESSDSDVDPEIEKLIAARSGKKIKKRNSERRGRSRKRSGKRSKRCDNDDDDEEERRKEKRRAEKEKRRNSGSDDDEEEGHRGRKSRKDRKRRRSHKRRDVSDDGSEEESDGYTRRRYTRKDAHESDSDGYVADRHHRRRRHRRKVSPSGSDTSCSGYEEDSLRKKCSKRKSKHNMRD
ncbi:CAX-interacting protein 4 [Apostasia shenzhenica]|uniref:CAX-interacting protein 4 n=1 Tax=Apostasia shenzhenica TaxID=1088818 RepID=A0A2I0B2A9_9ASPA|nr:CAX-interacting protein 4 [Apostasia shenzhenica]